MEAVKEALKHSPNPAWEVGIPILFIVLAIIYFSLASWYKNKYGLYRSQTDSINSLLALRRQILDSAIGPLVPNTESVCGNLLGKKGIYVRIKENETAIVNWRPLSVRMAGYLGGDNTVLDGVFDMKKGIQLALQMGARCFIFDIDYLEEKPCEPRLIHRDDQGVMRSLHTGSIKDGMDTINKMAFNINYDPVIVVVYLRRLPPGKTQKATYFKAIAAALDPLAEFVRDLIPIPGVNPTAQRGPAQGPRAEVIGEVDQGGHAIGVVDPGA